MRTACTAVVAVALLGACNTTDPTLDSASQLEGIKRCVNDGDCDGGTCCNERCENVSLSMRACGACGTACDAPTFCDGVSCAPFSFDALCVNNAILVVHREAKVVDGQNDDPEADNSAADDLAVSLAEICNNLAPPPALGSEDSVLTSSGSGPLKTGRGTALIVAGGPVYSAVVAYLDNVDVTPVELVVGADGDSFQLVARSQRKVVASDRLTLLGPNRDYIIGQAIYDATSGTQVLNVYGIFRGGTSMGAAYFAGLANEATAAGERWFVAKAENGSVTRLAGE